MRRAMLGFFPLKQSFLIFLNKLSNGKDEDYYPDFSEDRFREIEDYEIALELYTHHDMERVKSMNALSRAIMKWNTEDSAKRIQTPTLIIHGENDFLVPVKTAYELHEMIKNSKIVVIPNAGHGIVFRDSDEVNIEMERFLSEIYSGKSKI